MLLELYSGSCLADTYFAHQRKTVLYLYRMLLELYSGPRLADSDAQCEMTRDLKQLEQELARIEYVQSDFVKQ